jgi:hypothetical protein
VVEGVEKKGGGKEGVERKGGVTVVRKDEKRGRVLKWYR